MISSILSRYPFHNGGNHIHITSLASQITAKSSEFKSFKITKDADYQETQLKSSRASDFQFESSSWCCKDSELYLNETTGYNIEIRPPAFHQVKHVGFPNRTSYNPFNRPGGKVTAQLLRLRLKTI